MARLLMIHKQAQLDEKLKARTPFFKGLWISICLVVKFMGSLGPQNWSMQKLATAGKEDPLGQSQLNKPTTTTVNTLK